MVHRAIRYLLRCGVDGQELRERVERNLQPIKSARKLKREDIYPYDLNSVLQFGEQCSLTERRADDATREVVSWLKCEFLRNRVGDEFEGVVSAVTNFGLFVELKDLYVEGLIHVTALPGDYYHYEQAHHRLIGERTRKMFRLGDELKVRVVAVNLDERKIDFELVELKSKKKVKVSSKAKLLAEKHEQERARRSGGRGKKTDAKPRKRSAQPPAGSSRELKRNLLADAKAAKSKDSTATTKKSSRSSDQKEAGQKTNVPGKSSFPKKGRSNTSASKSKKSRK
jgi:ribonuclease R